MLVEQTFNLLLKLCYCVRCRNAIIYTFHVWLTSKIFGIFLMSLICPKVDVFVRLFGRGMVVIAYIRTQ